MAAHLKECAAIFAYKGGVFHDKPYQTLSIPPLAQETRCRAYTHYIGLLDCIEWRAVQEGGEFMTYDELKQLSDIEISTDTCINAGSCNACVNRSIKNVTIINLRGLSFRLCTFCKHELINMLRGGWQVVAGRSNRRRNELAMD